MGRAEWQREIDNAMRHDNWSLRGPNRPVKVVGVGPQAGGIIRAGFGYFTVAVSIAGMNVGEIVAALGLNADEFAFGAFIYPFARLPNPSEYEYRSTASYPDGLAYIPAFSSKLYPPGSAKIHQWQLNKGATVPLDFAGAVRLHLVERYPG